MKKLIYTIGYTGFAVNEFIELLKQKNINVVIDVRSTPYSERYAEYNKESLEKVLKENRIYYRNYVSEFGARQDSPEFYSSEGYLDFELFSKSQQFSNGVNKICNSIEQGYGIVILCAEKKPIQCHRTILVARAFSQLGYDVIHLMPSAQTMSQKQVESELLNKYFPSRGQISLFSECNMTDEECLREAYRMQNKKIGYRMDGEDE